MISEKPTALYRAYDADGQLLYVGIAGDWGHRWSHHRTRSPFYDDVARLDIEWHPTRAAAAAAEREAIENEKPIHNIAHTPRDTRPHRWRGRATRTQLYARDFDHTAFAHLVSYLKLYEAIDQFAKSDHDLTSQEGLVQTLAEMARSVPYGDLCDTCSHIAYPAAVQVSGASMQALYVHCGRRWACGWAVDAPLWW